MLADRSGLTAELSTALRRRSFTPVHDRGRVLVDVAVMLADGGEAICDRDGWRYQIVATNTAHTPGQQLAFLEARHRAHARVEDRIRHAKDTGLGRFPSREFKINQAWLTLTAIATDLVAWLRLLALTGDAAELATCEPKTLRYRLLHVPARLTHGGRRRRLRIPPTWPWADQIPAAFANIAAIPKPACPPRSPSPTR